MPPPIVLDIVVTSNFFFQQIHLRGLHMEPPRPPRRTPTLRPRPRQSGKRDHRQGTKKETKRAIKKIGRAIIDVRVWLCICVLGLESGLFSWPTHRRRVWLCWVLSRAYSAGQPIVGVCGGDHVKWIPACSHAVTSSRGYFRSSCYLWNMSDLWS